MFKPVSREQNRLRLALDAPTGGGKTFTALRFAFGILGQEGGKVAFIDTEFNSASLYAGMAPDGIPWKWDGVNLEHFAPSTYTQAIKEAARLGYTILVIDSLSHAWIGTGGALEQVDRASNNAGGKFGAWRDVTPQHNAMVDALVRYPGHVIVTLRSKMEYVLEEDERGKKTVKKVGLKPVQREGVEYEFTVVGDMDEEHRLKVSKTRCPIIDGAIVSKPGPEFILPVVRWLYEGSPEAPAIAPVETPAVAQAAPAGIRLNGTRLADEHRILQIRTAAEALGWGPEKVKETIGKRGFQKLAELPDDVAVALIEAMRGKLLKEEGKKAF